MITHDVKQGTKEWHDLRLNHFTASEASAMLGLSPYMSRTELLTLKKTGIAKEVDAQTQKRFDAGHATEALARPIIESMIGEDLFPVTGTISTYGLNLLSSFDGLTMLEDVIFEHKIMNQKLAISMVNNIIPDQYHPQLEQQLLVSGAEKAIFVVSDGTEESMFHAEYFSDPDLRKTLISGWKQFAIDLESFEPVEVQTKPEAKHLMELPALSIAIMGEVSSSNLAVYKATALQFIQNINTDLQTDQDFVDAENTIKFCDRAEKELETVKKQALGQTADIDLLFKTVDQLKEEMRSKRLTLNKLVKSQKETLKIGIVQKAQKAFSDHIGELNAEIKILTLPLISSDFSGAIKGKRNLSSMNDAVDTELARVKIEADNLASTIRQNLSYLIDKYGRKHDALFRDMKDIALKPLDDFINLVESRVSTHIEAEKKRVEAEREQIRQEEQRKAEQAAKAKLDAERKAIQEEERKKAREAEAKRIEAENIEAAKKRVEAERERKSQELNERLHQESIKSDLEKHQPEPVQKVEPVAEATKAVQVEAPEEKITISLSEYEQLTKDSEFLSALQASGVDNWDGYSYAQELFAEQQAA